MRPATVVATDATLREVAATMLEGHVPVVLVANAHGEVVGVVTERHLTLNEGFLRLACLHVPRIDGRPVTLLDEVEAACVAAGTLTTGEVMDRRLTFATPDERVAPVVERMLRREVDYAVVRRGVELVGILDSHALLGGMAGHRRVVPGLCASPSDDHYVRLTVGHPPRSIADRLFGPFN